MTSPLLPTFVIIGAQKSGTRWLRDALDAHPDIFAAERELEYFNHNFDRGLPWYSEHFRGAGKFLHRGEATPGYMMLTDDPQRSAARIDGCLPGVHVVALLRHPVDRLCSAFVHHARMGTLPSVQPLMRYVQEVDPETDPLGLVSGGWYARSLAPYVERFGDRLLVALHDDVQERPARLYRQVVEHVGADTSFTPLGLGTVRYSNREAVRKEVLEAVELTAADRAKLYADWYASEMEALERLCDLDVSRWHPGT